MTVVVDVDGKTKWIEISREQVNEIQTIDNLVKKLSKDFNTEDVVFLGVCEA